MASKKVFPLSRFSKQVISITFFFYILAIIPGLGQLQENYFYDEEPKDRGYVKLSAMCGNDIVFSGTTMTKSGSQVSITKIDRQGNIVWVSGFPESDVITKLITGSDGAVYACMTENSSSYILKIDALTGSTVWKTAFVAARWAYTFLDFDSDELLIGFASAYDGSLYTQKIGFVNKTTGNLIVHQIGKVSGGNENFGLAFDTDKNLYYTLKDTVYRMSGNGSFTLHWKRHHPTTLINNIQRIHIDQNNKMFLLGSKNSTFNRGIVIGINPTNGDVLSNVTADTWDAEFGALAENSTHLFVTWKPLGIGGYCGWWTTKIEKATGVISWNSSYNLNGTQLSTTLDTDHEVAEDIKVDENGDVYVTGSFDGTGVDPGKWGVAKLNGSTGIPIYNQLVFGNQPTVEHQRSGGISVYLLNNKVCTVGNSQTHDNRSTPAYVTLDPALGTVLTQSYYYGDYEFQSQILAMERQGNDMVVLKQIGRSLRLVKYDVQQNVKWEKTIANEYLLKDGKIRLTASGKIAIATLNHDISNYDPYFDNTLALGVYTYMFESDGTLSWSNHFDRHAGAGFENIGIFNLADLHADENNLFVFFSKDSELKARKVTATSVSSEVLVDISLRKNNILPYVFDDTGATIRVAGIKTSVGARVITFNKSTMIATITPFVYPFSEIGCITKINADEFIISGKDIKSQNFITRYNLTLQQTVWTRVLGNTTSWTFKILKPSIEPALVTIGTDNNYTAIRKLDFNNGRILGTYINTTVGIKNIPVDAAINEITGEIVFAGYYQSSEKSILIGSVKFSDLAPLHTLQILGTFDGDNVATTIEASADGKIWIGGNKNIDPLHKAAFIYTGSLATPATDMQPPLVTSATPSPGSSSKPSSTLILNFNENITLGTGVLKVFDGSSGNDNQLSQFQLTPSNTIVAGTKVTITPPTNLLPANKSIYLKLDADTFEDAAGNDFQGSLDKGWAFSTDSGAPTLSAKSPGTGALVKRNSVLQFTFNEAIKIGSGSIKIYSSTTGPLIEAIPINTDNTAIEGTVAIVKRMVLLPDNTTVYVKIDAGAFQDMAGNPYAGISNNSWYFGTSNTDSRSPEIVNLIPNVNSTVSPNLSLEIALDEYIYLNTGSFHIFDAATDVLLGTIALTPANTSIDNIFGNGLAYITQQVPLPAGKNLYIKIDEGVFTDRTGNPFKGIQDKSWAFTTTIPADQLVTIIPTPNAVNVSPYVSLYLEFTESMIPNSGYAGMSVYDYDTDQLLTTFKVTASNTLAWGSKVFVTPEQPLPSGKHIYVKVDNGSFRSISLSPSSRFAGIQDKQWHFSTFAIADTQGPLLESKTPADLAMNVSTGASLQLMFSEDIALGSGNIRIFNASTDAIVNVIPLTVSNTVLAGKQATVTLSSSLTTNTSYYIKVDNGTFKDPANNVFAGIQDKSWLFSTAAAPDIQAPVLSSTIPANGAINVSTNTSLQLTFSEKIILGVGSIRIFNASTDASVSTITLTSANTVIAGTQATVTLSSALIANTSFYVKVDNGAFKDQANNLFAGLLDKSWSFSTAPIADSQPPLLISTTPASGAINVTTTTLLQLTFSENIVLGSGSIRIFNASTDAVINTTALAVSNTVVAGTQATVTLSSALAATTSFYVKVDNGAFKDQANNLFAGLLDKSWSFSTSSLSVDNAAPLIISTSPAHLETNVDSESSLIITFSEPVILVGGQVSIVYDHNGLISTIPIELTPANTTVSGAVVTIKPDQALLSGAAVNVLIDNGVFKDLNNNDFTGIASSGEWAFTIRFIPDVVAPLLNATVPANGEIVPDPVSSLILKFNEPVELVGGRLTVLQDLTNNMLMQVDLESANTTVNESTVTITLPQPISVNEQVYVQLASASIIDTAGNEFSGIADKRWRFSTTKLITGNEELSQADGLQITGDGNFIRIKPTNNLVSVKAITDILGREIKFERSGSEAILIKPAGLFIVLGTSGHKMLEWKIILQTP